MIRDGKLWVWGSVFTFYQLEPHSERPCHCARKCATAHKNFKTDEKRKTIKIGVDITQVPKITAEES